MPFRRLGDRTVQWLLVTAMLAPMIAATRVRLDWAVPALTVVGIPFVLAAAYVTAFGRVRRKRLWTSLTAIAGMAWPLMTLIGVARDAL